MTKRDTAAFLQVRVAEELDGIKITDLFLYGSVSKIPPLYLPLLNLPEPTTSFDEKSDYDFAVDYAKYAPKNLNDCGWVHLPDKDYYDRTTMHVWTKTFNEGVVHLSFRHNFSAFRSMWDSISPEFYWEFLNKRSPSYMGKEWVTHYLNHLTDLADGVWSAPTPQRRAAPPPLRLARAALALFPE